MALSHIIFFLIHRVDITVRGAGHIFALALPYSATKQAKCVMQHSGLLERDSLGRAAALSPLLETQQYDLAEESTSDRLEDSSHALLARAVPVGG